VYDVVADVDSYKEFVPACSDSKVLKQEGNQMEVCIDNDRHYSAIHMLTCVYPKADLVVGVGDIKEKYTSQVTLHPKQLIEVRMSLVWKLNYPIDLTSSPFTKDQSSEHPTVSPPVQPLGVRSRY